jgi:hypothetical protein
MADGKIIYQPENPPPAVYPPPAGYHQGPPPATYNQPLPQSYVPPPSYNPPQSYPPQQAYPPPQQNYQPMYQAVPNAPPVIITNVHVNPIFLSHPVHAACKHCQTTVTTRVEAHMGCMVWLMFLIFYMVSPCISCLPFCISSWYDTTHYCPRCSRALGVYSVM